MEMKGLRQIFALSIFLITTSLFGQGSLRGVVTDSLTHDPLIGCNVFIVGTAFGDAGNIEGKYLIAKIPEGEYKVRVSYIGYKAKESSVKIVSNLTTFLNVDLVPDVIQGKEIVVSAQAFGQAAAINQQISSNTIINVVSEQKIKELPDANAAEAIGRLPGVSILRSGGEANKVILRGLSDKYTNVTIDGVKIASTDASSRGLDLSTISQNSLAGIELFKALTPDKDADAIAGSINLVLKKAPSTREINVIAKGNYNQLMESLKQYDFYAKYGERFFDDFLGVQIHGNLENKIRSNERIDLDYDQTGENQKTYDINDFTLEFTDEIRKRDGFGIMLDINTPDNGSIKFNAEFNSTNRDYLLHSRDYPAGGGIGGSSVTYSYRDREQEIKTFNSSITGNNTIFNLQLNWGLSFAQSTAAFLYDYQLDFLEPSSNTTGMKPNTPRPKDNPEVLIPYAQNVFSAAPLQDAYYRTQNNLDKDKSAFLNILQEYSLGDQITGEFKFGGKYNSKTRNNNNTESYSPYRLGFWKSYEQLSDGTIRPKNFRGTLFDAFFQRFLANPLIQSVPFTDFLDSSPKSRDIYDLYKLNPLINRDKLRQWYDLNKNGVDQNGIAREYYIDPSVNANYYDITESVTAAYIMNTLKFGQSITFIAGLRVEKENNDYKNKYSKVDFTGFPVPKDDTRDTTSTYSETVYLPNFHLNIKATDFLNIRAAVYKSIARPDFNMRLNTYFAWRPSAVGTNRQLIIGNPILKTAQAWNFEINTSVYGNEIGLVSVSAFYKEIKDIAHMLNGINTTGNVLIEHLGLAWKTLHGESSYQLTVPYNSPKPTKVWGLEFEHQINFAFLPGLLKNIVLSYNASIVRSETWLIGSRTDTVKYYLPGIPFPFNRYEDHPIELKQQLENQPKFFGNISLGYDIAGFSARVSLFHQSEYNRSFSPSGRGDIIVNGYTRLDLALKQRITTNISMMVNVSNLTNIKEETSIFNRVNDYKILNTSERYGLTVDFGVNVIL